MTLLESIQTLREQLSPTASINIGSDKAFKENAARWSEYKAPQPGAVVNVASESDIQKTVAWAAANGVKFLAQAGGHGFTTTLKLGDGDIIINLRGMNEIIVDLEAGTVVVGAGALVGEVLAEAYKNKAHVVLGACNSVGAIGSCVGGGLSRLSGKYGLGVDNMLSARLITAGGECITVSASENPDLWWGLRGAGHSFGIISRLTLKAYPQINEGQHWMSTLIFTPDKMESVAGAINGLDWGKEMAVQPVFMVALWYPGPEGPATQAFASLLSAGPVVEQSAMTPYDQINANGDPFAPKGGQKAIYSASMPHIDPKALKEVWGEYVAFLGKHPQVNAFALFECHSLKKALEVPDDDTAFPHRQILIHGLVGVIYPDPAFAPNAETFGTKCRSILRNSSGLTKNRVYVNFAHGDEDKEEAYGDASRLEKLKVLKSKWDPAGCFNQYNPIV